ncbi:MAG TPA: hypothetical protein VF069_10175 [Streptosporangiaceae bacterium]
MSAVRDPLQAVRSRPAAPAGAAPVRPAVWLVAVGAAVTAIGCTLLRHNALSWDETVYLSQTNPRVPALFFSAPRSRGVPLVVAPLVGFTSSVMALRVYLAVVAGAGVVAAYWPWLRVVRDRWQVPLAATAFAGLWVVLFYTNRAMPNMYVAFGAVAAAGWTLRYAGERSRRALAGVAAGLALAALARPGDAFWVALPLLAVALGVRSRRRPALIGAIVAGLVAGGGPWVVEAFVRFGGPLQRLRETGRVEGGMGWRPAGLAMELHAVNGPSLCRPCTPGIGNVALSVWWLALPAVVAAGVWMAARAGEVARAALPAVCGVCVAVPYLFMVGYAAPRFLIPAYALFSLPAAELPVAIVHAASKRLRPIATGALAGALVLQVTSQMLVLVRHSGTHPHGFAAVAARLHALGVRPPCTLSGTDSFPIAYYAGCWAVPTSGRDNGAITPARFTAMAVRQPAAVLTRTGRAPAYARRWQRHRLTPGRRGVVAYVRVPR